MWYPQEPKSLKPNVWKNQKEKYDDSMHYQRSTRLNRNMGQTEDNKCNTVTENNRLKRLQQTILFLKICQKATAKYELYSDCLATEYLLKARYREDQENFYSSFKLEPKITF